MVERKTLTRTRTRKISRAFPCGYKIIKFKSFYKTKIYSSDKKCERLKKTNI
jgi:hypothetical protein